MYSEFKNKIYKLLRRSEKYTQTDMVYLAKGGFWLTVGQIISTSSSFILAIAFANLLPKEVYGNYKYVLSIFSILLITNLPGMNIAITRQVAQKILPSMTKIFKTKIKWSLLGTLAGLIISLYYYCQNSTTLAISFLIVSLFVLIVENLTIYTAYLHGDQRFDTITKFTIITKVLTIISVVTVLYFYKNVYFALLATFIPQTLVRIFFFFIFHKKYGGGTKEINQVTDYGKQLSFIDLISTIANKLDEILIFNFLGSGQLAIYAFAVAPTEQIKSVFKNIESLALPKFAQTSKEEIKKNIFKKSLKLALVILLVTIIYIVAAPFIYKLIFPQYIESVKYSQVLALSLVAIPIWIFQAAFKSQQMTKQIYHLEIFNSIMQIGVTLILVSNFGLWGAVFSRIIYRFLNLSASAWLLKRS